MEEAYLAGTSVKNAARYTVQLTKTQTVATEQTSLQLSREISISHKS